MDTPSGGSIGYLESYKGVRMGLLDLDSVHLVAIYVGDLSSSQRFYSDILGFEKKSDMGAGIIMRHESSKLTIYMEGNRVLRESPEMNFPMVSICFNAKEGVRRAMEVLRRADVPVIGTFGDLQSDFAGFHFVDPSGNVIEIAGRP
jgi:catechol-2,3-dioxygenase